MKKIARITAIVMIAVLSLAVLASCGPNSNPEKVSSILKGKDYVVIYTKRDDLGAMMGKLDYKISATKGKESITIYWYREAEDAKQGYQEEKQNLKEGQKVGRMGKMVWVGTKQAINDAR